MKEQILGYVLVNKNNKVLMIDNSIKLYFSNIELNDIHFSKDIILFKNLANKDRWIEESNIHRKFQDGTKVLPNDLKNLDFCKITISKV